MTSPLWLVPLRCFLCLGGGSSSAMDDPLSDPLSRMAVGMDDPLRGGQSGGSSSASSALSASSSSSVTSVHTETAAENAKASKQTSQEMHDAYLRTPWSIRKQQVLSEYAISGNITLNTTAIDEFSGSGVEDGSGAAPPSFLPPFDDAAVPLLLFNISFVVTVGRPVFHRTKNLYFLINIFGSTKLFFYCNQTWIRIIDKKKCHYYYYFV